jgi:hypothetical protein
MLRDKTGNRLFRTVKVRIIFPDAIFLPKTFVQHAGPHQGFGPNGIDEILMGIADQLETLYPFWDFKVSELAPEGRTARYVLTFAGYRATGNRIDPMRECSTPLQDLAAEIFKHTPPTESSILTPGVVASSPTEIQPTESREVVAAPQE